MNAVQRSLRQREDIQFREGNPPKLGQGRVHNKRKSVKRDLTWEKMKGGRLQRKGEKIKERKQVVLSVHLSVQLWTQSPKRKTGKKK